MLVKNSDSEISVSCPRCGIDLSMPVSSIGNHVRCPCGCRFQMEEDGSVFELENRVLKESLYLKAPYMLKPYLKIFSWGGRASRREFWWFHLTCLLVALLSFASLYFSSGICLRICLPVVGVVAISTILAFWSVGIRRLHDAGHAGWWILLLAINTGSPLANLIVTAVFYGVFMAKKSVPCANKWGNPYDEIKIIDADERAFLDDIIGCVVGVAGLYVSFAGLLIHLYTLYIAAKMSGFVAMGLSFVAPVLAEIYWFVKITASKGIINPYSIIVLGCVISFAVIWFCVIIQDRRGKGM